MVLVNSGTCLGEGGIWKKLVGVNLGRLGTGPGKFLFGASKLVLQGGKGILGGAWVTGEIKG